MISRNNLFYGSIIFLNILISYGMLLYQQPFNVDGILYLNASQVYLTQGLHAAMQIYPWPLYSVLLAKISQFTSLSLLQTAFLLNAIFTSILVFYFVRLIHLLGGTFRHQCWAAALILLYPYLNHDRYNVLRDFGYYAFFVTSLYYFIAFLNTHKIRDALLWQITLMIATGFRIEGAVLLSLCPIAVLLIPAESFRQKIINFFKSSWILLIALIIASICFKSFWHFGRIPDLASALSLDQLIPLLSQKITALQQQVLNIPGKDDAWLFLTAGIIAVFFHTALETLGFILSALFIYTCLTKSIQIQTKARHGLVVYATIIILTLIVFLLHQLFLVGRYIAPLILICLLLLPFGLEHLWQKKHWAAKLIVISILLFNTGASFGQFGPSKTYLIEAGKWIEANTPVNSHIYANNAQLSYYASRNNLLYDPNLLLQQTHFNDYNYIAITLRHTDNMMTEQQLLQITGHPPLKVFQNKRGDKTFIFAMKSN